MNHIFYRSTIALRNRLLHIAYLSVFKPLAFRLDPEYVHDHMTKVGKLLGAHTITRTFTSWLFNFHNPILEQTIAGIHFKNPVGLSAGFDKNVELTDILPAVGFGFTEVGSITGLPCAGNAKPRLWRLPKSKSLAVYYGLKNDGCEAIAQRLTNKKMKLPIGISVAMTNCAANIDIATSIEDYVLAFVTMEPFANYITINISCPNTLGGQPFISPDNLEQLLSKLDTCATTKPVFVKLSPDISHEQVDQTLEVLKRHRVQGIICTNLTKDRSHIDPSEQNITSKGGLSGTLTKDASNALISYIYKKEKERFILIGTGGISSAEDAYRKIRNGASLVQLITGMIFEGPQLISDINLGLSELLKRDGYTSIQEAIGVDVA